MKNNLVETLIGALVLGVAAFFLLYAYNTSGAKKTSGGYEVVAKFDRIDGLASGADVRMSGIKIGTVTASTLDPKTYQAVVHIAVDASVKLPDDSTAKISSEGLLGGNYLALEPGGSDTVLKPGGEIRFTQGSVNLMDLIGKAIFSAAAPAAPPADKPAN